MESLVQLNHGKEKISSIYFKKPKKVEESKSSKTFVSLAEERKKMFEM